jgi:hypothetical protein
LFFTRRKWALRITEEMGLPAKSKETTHLVDMSIWAAKQDDQMFDKGGIPRIDKPRGILMSGVTMVNNKSAIKNTASSLNLSDEDAIHLLKNMHLAAIRVAKQSGFDDLVELAQRRSID